MTAQVTGTPMEQLPSRAVLQGTPNERLHQAAREGAELGLINTLMESASPSALVGRGLHHRPSSSLYEAIKRANTEADLLVIEAMLRNPRSVRTVGKRSAWGEMDTPIKLARKPGKREILKLLEHLPLTQAEHHARITLPRPTTSPPLSRRQTVVVENPAQTAEAASGQNHPLGHLSREELMQCLIACDEEFFATLTENYDLVSVADLIQDAHTAQISADPAVEGWLSDKLLATLDHPDCNIDETNLPEALKQRAWEFKQLRLQSTESTEI